MRKGWEIKKLGDVCTYDKTSNKRKDLPYVGLEDIESNTGKFIGSYDVQTVKSSTFYFTDKHILYGRLRPYLNKVLLPNYYGHCSTEIFPISLKSGIEKKFLFYWLTSSDVVEKINATWTGARMPRANMNAVLEFELFIPSLPEQQHIVSILDRAFAAIDKAKANTEKNLQNAKALFESYLQNIFAEKGENWEEKRLDETFEIKPPKSEAKNMLKENELVSFLPMEDLNVLAYEIRPVKKKSLKEVVGSYTYFAEHDVLLAKITPCFENGKIGIARNLINQIGFGSSEYIVFRSKKEIIPEFLYFYLSRSSFRKEGRERMTGAVGHKRVSKEFIEEYRIPFPKSIKKQEAIVAKLVQYNNETKKLAAIYQQKLNNLEELKKSILQKAFSGELTGEAVAV